jgi:hypothetical protein
MVVEGRACTGGDEDRLRPSKERMANNTNNAGQSLRTNSTRFRRVDTDIYVLVFVYRFLFYLLTFIIPENKG